MNEPAWLKVTFYAFFALYPVAVYFGLRNFEPKWLSVLLLIFAARYLMGDMFSVLVRNIWAGCIILLALSILATDSAIGLLIYPVFMNILMFVLFFSSYLNPPTFIENLVRIKQKHISEEIIVYTRKLTLVWCGFFLVNGSISIYTITVNHEVWALYNGLISYLLIGILFGGEIIVRKFMMAKSHQQ